MSHTAAALLRGEPVSCTSGRHARDFLWIDFAVEILVQLLLSEVEGPVNVGSGRASTIPQMVQPLADLLGRSSLLRFDLPVADEVPFLQADTQRLTRELGFESADLQHQKGQLEIFLQSIRETVNL